MRRLKRKTLGEGKNSALGGVAAFHPSSCRRGTPQSQKLAADICKNEKIDAQRATARGTYLTLSGNVANTVIARAAYAA
jgi:hypothetical protein